MTSFRPRRLASAGLAVLVTLPPGSRAGEEPVGAYVLHLADVHARSARVEARVRVARGRLRTGLGGAFEGTAGWEQYVRGLVARTPAGRALSLAPGGAGPDFAWLASGPSGPWEGDALLEYEVDLSYADVDWAAGNEQFGRRLDGWLFTVTKPLFVASEVEGPREVVLDVPPEWSVATPWAPGAGGAYRVAGLESLQRNTIVLGSFPGATLETAGFELRLALPGLGGAEELLGSALRRVLPLYLSVFPGTPRGAWLLTVLPGATDDAEACFDGAAITLASPVREDTALVWGGFVAHELFHGWNGQRLRGEPRADRQWLSEGFTEYYANLALVNAGVVGERGFVEKLERHLAHYLYFLASPAHEGVSLRAAGSRKGLHRFGVYDGGWAAAFVLDHELRRATRGSASLDDVLGLLWERFAVPGRSYALADVQAALVEVGGEALAGFLDRHVEGREVLPVQEVLRAYGWEGLAKPYAAELYVVEDPAATAAERAERRWLLEERFQ